MHARLVNDPVGGGPPIVRVAVQHTHGMWVDTLRTLLVGRDDIELTEAHTNAGWVDHAVRSGWVDVLVLSMEESVGELSSRLRRLSDAPHRLRVVGLGERPEPRVLLGAVRCGIRGWVEPTDSVERLVAILHGVARGETWLPRTMLTEVLDGLTTTEKTREETQSALSVLSDRELEVLGCLATGMSRREIAERYVLSPHTVRTHITNVLRKLDVHSTLAAVSLARESGIIASRSAHDAS